MALVTMEAGKAPPIIDAALEADSHVFAEKPACVRVEDFAPLVWKAQSKHRHLMLALANRTNPEIVAAQELVASGQIGSLYGVDMHLIADQTRLKQASYREQWFADKEPELVLEPLGTRSNYWLNAILLKDKEERDSFLKYTNERGVMTRPMWTPMHTLPMYQNCQRGDVTIAKNIESRLVNIPSSVI